MKKNSKKGTAKYFISKIIMNALYGKMCQKPILEKHIICEKMEDYYKLTEDENNIITGYELIYNNNNEMSAIVFNYTFKNKNEMIDKPTFLGAMILSRSREIMDNLIFNKADMYKDINNMLFITDTDSAIVQNATYQKLLKDGYNPAELGKLAYDINGPIIEYYSIAPKVYITKYIDFDSGEIRLHKRAKGFKSKYIGELTTEDYRNMVEKDKLITMTTDINKKSDENNKIINCERVFKRLNIKLNSKQHEKQYSQFAIAMENFERTLNKSKYNKRININDEYMTTIPIQFEN